VLAGARSQPMPGTLSGPLVRKDGPSAPPPAARVSMAPASGLIRASFGSDKGLYVD